MAEQLEVSRQSVNAIETGKYDPSLPLAFRIAELFELPIEEIFVSPSRTQLGRHLNLQQEKCHASHLSMILAVLRRRHARLERGRACSAAGRIRATAEPHHHHTTWPRLAGRADPRPGFAAAVFDGLAAKIGPITGLIFVQVNGFAGSTAGSAPLDSLMPGAVDELAGWLAANHVEKPAVIGHSMGGLMALMLAKRHPEAAGRLMIVDSLPFYGMLFGPSGDARRVRPVRRADARRPRQRRQPAASAAAHVEHRRRQGEGPRLAESVRPEDRRRSIGRGCNDRRTPGLAGDRWNACHGALRSPSPEMKPMADGLYTEAYKGLPGVKLVAGGQE